MCCKQLVGEPVAAKYIALFFACCIADGRRLFVDKQSRRGAYPTTVCATGSGITVAAKCTIFIFVAFGTVQDWPYGLVAFVFI